MTGTVSVAPVPALVARPVPSVVPPEVARTSTPSAGRAPFKVTVYVPPVYGISPEGLTVELVICGVGSCVRFSMFVHVPFHKYWKATVRFERLELAGRLNTALAPLETTVACTSVPPEKART